MKDAEVIEEARIKEISATADGTGYLVRLDNGKTYTLGKKALWGWGRLQEGRLKFDAHVQDTYADLLKKEGLDPQTAPKQDQIRLRRQASSKAFGEVYNDLEDQRDFQAIITATRHGAPQLFSVATFKHVLLDPERVMEIGKTVFSSLGVNEYGRHSGIVEKGQLLGLYGEHNGLNLGLSFSAGNIYTQFAISISQMVELQICTNPLVWLRGMLSSYVKGGRIQWKARILRLTTIGDEKLLESRLIETVKDVQSGEKGLLAIIQSSKTKTLTSQMAETILKAFCGSYGIGEGIQGEIMSEHKESSSKSLYDLAQAASHVAWSSQGFREGADRARSVLTGIAAVLTTIQDVKGTYEACKQRLEVKAK